MSKHDENKATIQEWTRKFLQDDEIEFVSTTTAYFDLKRPIRNSVFGILLRFYFKKLTSGRTVVGGARLGIRFMMDASSKQEWLQNIMHNRNEFDIEVIRNLTLKTKNHMSNEPPCKQGSLGANLIQTAKDIGHPDILEDRHYLNQGATTLEQWCGLMKPRFDDIKLFFVQYIILQGSAFNTTSPI